MRISLHNQTEENISEIKDLMKSIFKNVKEKKNMQVIFVTQDAIHELNKTYRQMDKPTDVLSFINDDAEDNSLGDVFISIEQAKKQAVDYGHSFEREIGFLAVHGYLHLKGFDHHTEAEEKLMVLEQEKILKTASLERK
ncbi:MAG: rRNA maturation RNase YbeY [Tenericutes bacterium GWE2_38_8]|nr:MAG: rRNA maturation RNase YbeY [Tenericutes bacterium GWE2_38_8]OHE42422.1 MAG: rRNA maturation RNase YbeY [Tenericutes bacterium GWF2_38_8]HBG33185.1 rRNA maturation RNase YbeY [Acholeplasmataceae bacterium]HCB66930.1 rRNA maturation RNase YbeY [Acholeplasmataceae bacterium]